MKKSIHILAALAFLFCQSVAAQQLTSPNGRLEMNFGLSKEGVPHYALTYKGKTVIKESRLGYSLKPNYSFDEGFEIIDTAFKESDSIWHPVLGENKDIR